MEQQELDYGIGIIGLLVCVVGMYLIGLMTVKVMADRRVATALEAIVVQNNVGSARP